MTNFPRWIKEIITEFSAEAFEGPLRHLHKKINNVFDILKIFYQFHDTSNFVDFYKKVRGNMFVLPDYWHWYLLAE